MLDSDADWTNNEESRYYVCHSQNEPLQARYRDSFVNCLEVAATDVTGWDRSMPSMGLYYFFYCYLPRVCIGMPEQVVEYMFRNTTFSLLCSLDELHIKAHGNPSGFPNTIRLNCVVHRAVNLLLASLALEKAGQSMDFDEVESEFFSLYCGDDVINFAMTDRVRAIMPKQGSPGSLIELWSTLTPWVVKLEGHMVLEGLDPLTVDLTDFPPFVSHKPIRLYGEWYFALCKPEKVITKVLLEGSGCNESEKRKNVAEVVLGVTVSLLHSVLKHLDRDFSESWPEDPVVNFLISRWEPDHAELLEAGSKQKNLKRFLVSLLPYGEAKRENVAHF